MLTKDEIQTLFHILYNNGEGDDIELALGIIKNNKHTFHPWQIIAFMLLCKPQMNNKWERIEEIYNIKKWADVHDFAFGWRGIEDEYWTEIIHETNGDYDKVEYALYHHFLNKIQQLTDHFTSIKRYVHQG